MSDRPSTAEAGLRVLPLFPLPDTVFFPRTTLPLHVFEPRYRAMVRDATAGDGRIVVALASGEGFRRLATVGRIRELEPLPDGRYNLRLEGLERVWLSEVPADTPYRRVRVEPRPESTGTDDALAIAEARLDLLSSYAVLRRMVRGDEPLVLNEALPFEVVVNTACAELPIDAAARQQLLEADSLMERQRLGLRHATAVIEALSWMRAARPDEDDTPLN